MWEILNISLVPHNTIFMSKRSKRYTEFSKTLTKGSKYNLLEAIGLLKGSTNTTKFDQTVELHIQLGIDPKKSDQLIRAAVQLPHGTGKVKRIVAFVGPNNEADAKEAGADLIGNEDVINEIKTTGKINFDIAIATPDMMKQLAPIARILGQKGLMPNPKNETVGTDVKKMIRALKTGKVNFKNDATGNIHLAVGKLSFTDEQLQENAKAAMDAIKKAKPNTAKGTYIKSSTLCSTMSPGIPVDIN